MKDSLLENKIERLNLGQEFWDEMGKKTIIHIIERGYNADILKIWYISDLVMNGDQVLIKWTKRFKVLSDEEIKEKYDK